MKTRLLPYFVLLCGFCGSLYASEPKEASTTWSGVDETVIEKHAEAAGRSAREPLINTDQGDLLLFVFLLAGALGGFVAGYTFRGLTSASKKTSATLLLTFALFNLAVCADEVHVEARSPHQHIHTPSENPFSYELRLDFYTKAMRNGMVEYDHPLFQPGVRLEYEDSTLGTLAGSAVFLWPIGAPRPARAAGIEEMNYIVSWGKSFGPVDIELGFTYYAIPPDCADDLYEGFLSLRYENDWVTPYLVGYYDLNQTDGTYLKAGLCKGFKLTDKLKLDMDLTCGYGFPKYNQGYFDTDISAFTDATAQILLQYDITDNFFIGSTAAFSMLLDNAIRDSRFVNSTYDTVDTLWFGLHTGIHF
jgi:hypothetical protein